MNKWCYVSFDRFYEVDNSRQKKLIGKSHISSDLKPYRNSFRIHNNGFAIL